MATTVYTVETVVLQDDDNTELTLKPLNIKNLRKFMKKMDEFSGAEKEEDIVDSLIDAALLCVAKQLGEKADDRDWVEDAFDMPTVYKVIEVCGGIKLNDPNLINQAMEMAQQAGPN